MDCVVTRPGKTRRRRATKATRRPGISLSSAKGQLVLVNGGGGGPQCVADVVRRELGKLHQASAVVIASAIMATIVVTGIRVPLMHGTPPMIR